MAPKGKRKMQAASPLSVNKAQAYEMSTETPMPYKVRALPKLRRDHLSRRIDPRQNRRVALTRDPKPL